MSAFYKIDKLHFRLCDVEWFDSVQKSIMREDEFLRVKLKNYAVPVEVKTGERTEDELYKLAKKLEVM